MPIFIGIIVLSIVFLVFGSKTEEASVIYYDPPGAESTPSVRKASTEEVEDYDATAGDVEFADVPAEVAGDSAAQDAAATAQEIYDNISL